MFELVKGETIIPTDKEVIKRIAIKCICVQEGKLLLLKTNQGDYKIPGGGQKENETDIETLKREVAEETGFELINVDKMIGSLTETRADRFKADAYFSMTDYYYLCDVNLLNKNDQTLDTYEEELNMKPLLVTLEDAISNNISLLECLDKEYTSQWIERELLVFEELSEYII